MRKLKKTKQNKTLLLTDDRQFGFFFLNKILKHWEQGTWVVVVVVVCLPLASLDCVGTDRRSANSHGSVPMDCSTFRAIALLRLACNQLLRPWLCLRSGTWTNGRHVESRQNKHLN
jgi:hypothetical protein